MHKIFKQISLSVMILCISVLTAISAQAAECRFTDVTPDAPYFEAVSYLYDNGITVGTGDGCYSPNAPITVRQWSVMLCRAFGRAETLEEEAFGDACLREAYRSGWFTETAVLEPDTRMCQGALYESAFDAMGLPVYDYALYPGGTVLSTYDNCLRIGADLDLCPENTEATKIVTRGEVGVLLHALLTQDLQIHEPPVLMAFPIENREDVNMNDYLLALQSVPEPILQAFREKGWTYAVDFEYLANLSRQRNVSCTGAADYAGKHIYVSEASSTLHEFGHFLDYMLGSPSKTNGLFEEEGEATTAFLRNYARTNCREYFADCFVYWVRYQENTAKMELFQKNAPKTYTYFRQLDAVGWI